MNKMVQSIAVRAYVRNFAAACEQIGFLIEDLVTHEKLQQAMSLLEMTVPHHLLEAYGEKCAVLGCSRRVAAVRGKSCLSVRTSRVCLCEVPAACLESADIAIESSTFARKRERVSARESE